MTEIWFTVTYSSDVEHKRHIVMFQAFVVQTSISRVTTSVNAGILEPFEQNTLCFDKGE